MTTVAVRDLLVSLGFEEEWGHWTDEEPSYFFDFGNMRLEAAQFAMDPRFMAPHFQFSGSWQTNRSLASVDFRLSLKVESSEVGTALIAYHIGRDFIPSVITPWLDQGRGWKDRLPWERDRKAYEARPFCGVDRQWFRLMAKSLRFLAARAVEDDLASFSFDGQVLKIRAGENLLVAPATGMAWPSIYDLALHDLNRLPRRFMRDPVAIEMWDNCLRISGTPFDIVRQATSAGNHV